MSRTRSTISAMATHLSCPAGKRPCGNRLFVRTSRAPVPSDWDRGRGRAQVRGLRLLASLVRDRDLQQGVTANLALLTPGGQTEQGVGARIEDEDGPAAHEWPADADPRAAAYVL